MYSLIIIMFSNVHNVLGGSIAGRLDALITRQLWTLAQAALLILLNHTLYRTPFFALLIPGHFVQVGFER